MTDRVRRWQGVTLSSLTLGYIGYYFCRSNLAVVSPLLVERYGETGVDQEKMGMIMSAGVLTYALGKLINGTLADFVGGRRVFLWGMVGSVLATVLFGMGSGLSLFLAAWCINRFFQSGGWGALVKVASAWFSPLRMGTVMGILCLSYPIGDFSAKMVLGAFVRSGAN
ncbi:MAG: MFS transporter, partial [Myxococcales bacterium]|nr:MFS transporter [Myxococcales bacterium]